MAVRPMQPSDYEGVNRLYRSVGWPERSAAGWRWLYDNPARLEAKGLLYPCALTRRELDALPPRRGADGLEYPAGSRGLTPPEALTGMPYALRLDLDRAMPLAGALYWQDARAGRVAADPRPLGDVVLVRKDLPASYHLAATLDDAADGVTLVTRGMDLFPSTHVHRLLQQLIGLPVPEYLHHDLILDEDGTKLAKSRGSPALADRRLAGEDGGALARQLREQYHAARISAGT
jgi:glutamyl-Q tRNA(Asp) synthetase